MGHALSYRTLTTVAPLGLTRPYSRRMDMLTESDILDQVKQSQSGTDWRLDSLIAIQTRTNDLLEQLVRLAGGTVKPTGEEL